LVQRKPKGSVSRREGPAPVGAVRAAFQALLFPSALTYV